MAKLKARGRTCQIEVTREYTAEQLQRAHDRFQRRYQADYVDGSDPALTTWERVTRRLMSDGAVLEKRDVLFRAGPYDPPAGRRHSYGWKVHGKLKAGLTAEDFARAYSEPGKSGAPSPWTVARGAVGPSATPIISKRRLMAAIESGESIGFCTACGAEQSGVEPDASGYQCEGCGQLAVTGAEQLLLEVV